MKITIQTLIETLQTMIADGVPPDTNIMVNDSEHGIQQAEFAQHIKIENDEIALIEGANHQSDY